MAKVVLVSPDERRYLAHAGDREPLGLEYISAALKSENHDVSIVDLNHARTDNILDWFNPHFPPEFVGISIPSSPSFKYMQALGLAIGRYSRVIVGGRGITGHEIELENNGFTVIKGDGERTILRAVNGEKGILSEQIDIDEFPMPDRQSPKQYNMVIEETQCVPMVTSRGCPFGCAFCGNMAKRTQYRGLYNIQDELDELRRRKVQGIYIYDENFLQNKEHAMNVMEELGKRGFRYRIEARGKSIDRKVAEMLKATGCMLVAVGIEAADNRVLKAINKGEDLEDIIIGIHTLGRVGLISKGYFIFGLPEQDITSAKRSIDLAQHLKQRCGMKYVDFYSLTPFPGSPIGDNPERFGIKIKHKQYDKYLVAGSSEPEPVIETNWLSSTQIKDLVLKARSEVK